MPKTVNMTEYRTIFDFDLTQQDEILKELQTYGYQLIGYKGATGTNQITSGLPTWFSESFIEMVGQIEIDHEPVYKVYAYEESDLEQYRQIEMDFLSEECALGSKISLNKDGSFSILNDSAPKGCIQLIDNRPTGCKRIIVGLASKIIGRYAPFCAFYSSSQEIINMEPNDRICLFTSQTNISAGTVIKNLLGMGCSFEFSSSEKFYNLEMTRMPWGIKQTKPKDKVILRYPNQVLSRILNTNTHKLDSYYQKNELLMI